MATTPNGLELINVGGFLDDPSADTVTAFATKENTNMQLLDGVMTQVQATAGDVTILRNRGFIAGVIYGGSF